MEPYSLPIMFTVALFASAFGTLTGGASIVTIPTLMLLGLPPHVAIGTDRFGVIGLGLAGWFKFHKKGLIDYKIALWTFMSILLGTVVGANLVLGIAGNDLKNIVIFVNVCLALFIVLNRKTGVQSEKEEITSRKYLLGVVLSFFVGIYGGFYGALAGTFALYVSVLVFKQTFIEGAATQKLGTCVNAITASIIFALNDSVDFVFGSTMFVGCLIGSYLGAHFSDKIGEIWVKRLFITIMIVAVAKLAFSN